MAVSPEQLYEQTLVLRSQIGDEAAFSELLNLYGPRLLLFTQRMMKSSPDAVADVTQEIWISIFRSLPRLLDPMKFKPWAFRIARDRIFREYRRRKLAIQPLDEETTGEVAETTDAISPAELEQLHACLDALSPEHREALVLRYLEEMSYEEIAGVTGASIGTVRSRIFYAKAALKTVWKEQSL